MFTNHIKFFNYYNIFKRDLHNIIMMPKNSIARNKAERSLIHRIWEPGASDDYEDDDPYLIGSSNRKKY
jgi:hypothetical protein